MRTHPSRVPLGLLLVLGTLLAVPARAADVARVDLDGDGVRDRASLEAGARISLWLSSTRQHHVVRAPVPLAHLAAADVDGDGRADLVATDEHSGLLLLHVGASVSVRHVAVPGRPGPLKSRPLGVGASTREDWTDVPANDGDDAALEVGAAPVHPHDPDVARLPRPPTTSPRAGSSVLCSLPRPPPAC